MVLLKKDRVHLCLRPNRFAFAFNIETFCFRTVEVDEGCLPLDTTTSSITPSSIQGKMHLGTTKRGGGRSLLEASTLAGTDWIIPKSSPLMPTKLPWWMTHPWMTMPMSCFFYAASSYPEFQVPLSLFDCVKEDKKQ